MNRQIKTTFILGWWSQPGFEALAIVRDRAVVRSFNNNNLFTGVIDYDDKGYIRPRSVLWDMNGPAQISGGNFNETRGTITFPKRYENEGRRDVINYEAAMNPKTGCWIGTFSGELVGQGFTRFLISDKFPEEIFRLRPTGQKLAPFIDEWQAQFPEEFFEGFEGPLDPASVE